MGQKDINRIRGHEYNSIVINGGTAIVGDAYGLPTLPAWDQKHHEVERHRSSLLESIRFPELHLRRNTISEAHQTTFEWLPEGSNTQRPWDDFVEWLRYGKEIYLIEGKPGSGKSTLMRFILDHPACKASLPLCLGDDGPLVIHHFFWLAGNEMQRSFRGMLATLAYQLVSGCSLGLFAFFYETDKYSHLKPEHKCRLPDWSDADLQSLVFEILHILCPRRSALFLVDGLDEFDHNDRPSRLTTFLHKLNTDSATRVCVSSRPLIWLERNFLEAKKLILHDHTREDIRRYASDILHDDFNFFDSDLAKEKEAILQIIVSKAEGVFLWVKYALHSLLEGIKAFDDARKLRKRLERLPKGMQELFQHMWQRHENSNESHKDEAAKFLVCGKLLPLSLFDMTVVVDSDIQAHYIRTAEPLPESRLEEACLTMKRKLMIRTAGLLCCQHESGLSEESALSRQPHLRGPKFSTRVYVTSEDRPKSLSHTFHPHVNYLHRTVHDFLWGTQAGLSLVGRPIVQNLDLPFRRFYAQLAAVIEELAPLAEPTVEFFHQYVHLKIEPQHQYRAMSMVDSIFSRLVMHRLKPTPIATSWLHQLQILHGTHTIAFHSDFVGYLAIKGDFDILLSFLGGNAVSTLYLRYLACCTVSGLRAKGRDGELSKLLQWLIYQDTPLLQKHRLPVTVNEEGFLCLSAVEHLLVHLLSTLTLDSVVELDQRNKLLACMLTRLSHCTTVLVPIVNCKHAGWQCRELSGMIYSAHSCTNFWWEGGLYVYCNVYIHKLHAVIEQYLINRHNAGSSTKR